MTALSLQTRFFPQSKSIFRRRWIRRDNVRDIFHLTTVLFTSDPAGKAFNVNALERFTNINIYIENMTEVAFNFKKNSRVRCL